MRTIPPPRGDGLPGSPPGPLEQSWSVHAAGAGLESAVEAFWDIRHQGGAGAECARIDILPIPAGTLSFQYKEAPTSHFNGEARRLRSHLTGVHTRTIAISTNGETGSVVAKLTPWGLARLLRVSAAEIADRQFELSCAFGAPDVARIEARLGDAADAAERVEIVRGFLRARLSETELDATLPVAFDRLRKTGGDCRTAALARSLGLSERQLERRFLREIGAPPKTIARIIRLHAALQTRLAGSGWADAAATSGFCDQAHLIREFRRVCGRSPTAYFGAAAASPWRRHTDHLRRTPFSNTVFV